MNEEKQQLKAIRARALINSMMCDRDVAITNLDGELTKEDFSLDRAHLHVNTISKANSNIQLITNLYFPQKEDKQES